MADYQYIDGTGVILADTSVVLAEVTEEYTNTFGDNLVTTPDSPAGMLITAESLARINVLGNNAVTANQINPNFAQGAFLDALMALTGIQRSDANQTYVSAVNLTGVTGTVIPANSIAATAAGDQFQSVASVTIGTGGTAVVDFQSIAEGPIPCAAGALTSVVSGILGWETLGNPNAGVLGTVTQPDPSARAYRNNTLGFQGVALPVAITSALYATQGVQSLRFQENDTAATATINGISMAAHSIYVCVNGGSNLNVAAALLENKSSGCGWNGSTSVSLVEPASGQTYAVLFDRPAVIGILVRVTTPNGNAANITQSILDYAAGNISGYPGFVVGSNVSPFEIAAAIVAENPGTFIGKVEISLSTGTPSYSTNEIAIGVNQIAETQASFITVVIGA